MTCLCTRMCLFGVAFILHLILGQMPQKLIFWAVNRHFQAKWAQYSNFHTIKTTMIQSKIRTMIKTTKYYLHYPKMLPQNHDGGWPLS